MGLQFIRRKPSGYSETAHSTAERGGLPGRKGLDFDFKGRRGHPLPDRAGVVLEETVENAVRCSGVDPHIDKANQFRRIDGDGPGLLRDQHIRPQDRRVVNLVVKALAFELDIAWRICLLTPETIE